VYTLDIVLVLKLYLNECKFYPADSIKLQAVVTGYFFSFFTENDGYTTLNFVKGFLK